MSNDELKLFLIDWGNVDQLLDLLAYVKEEGAFINVNYSAGDPAEIGFQLWRRADLAGADQGVGADKSASLGAMLTLTEAEIDKGALVAWPAGWFEEGE